MGQYERMPEQDVREAGLLAGLRGRELCARLAGIDVEALYEQLAPPQSGERLVADLVAAGQEPAADEGAFGASYGPAVVAVDPDDELFGVRELAEVAEGAGYWGGYPAGADPLDNPVLQPALRAMAARLSRAEGCRWWWSRIDRPAQGYVQWTERDGPAPVLGQAADVLRNVSAEDDERERSMHRYRRRRAGKGPHGEWWIHPFPGAISTTRRAGRLGALLLAGQEDGFGDTEAAVWPLAVSDTARIFEVDSPRAWQELVSGYPRPATSSYRHTWAWTGWDGDWLAPRWSAIARDWDAIHLTVAGYLSTAGSPLPVGIGRTMLAGWNPDQTYWLTDVLTHGGQAQAWHNDSGDPIGWRNR
jgi:hypothetical protein